MRRIFYRPYVLLVAFLFFVLSFPKEGAEKLRTFVISGIAPSWHLLYRAKCASISLLTIAPRSGLKVQSNEMEKLQLENHMLRQQLERFNQWLLADERLAQEWRRLKKLTSKEDNAFFQRRSQYLGDCIERQLQALPAKVIFREPALWSSSLWLNVGERDNRALGKIIVAKNSAIVIGRCIVGIVEEVTENTCRVRLITDRGLTPSVRAIRGGQQNRFLCEQIEALVQMLASREDLFGSEELRQALIHLKEELHPELPDLYLAKGELQGTSHPLWRSRSPILRGLGFNYDFADGEGPARDLRSGMLKDGSESIPLIKAGDLLVTTGMDGVFPADLYVGIVTKIFPLREGGCAYELEAISSAPNFNELTEVFVLPPF